MFLFFGFCNGKQYHFSGNQNVVKIFKLVQKAGLYVVLRIGPYVCAEWNYGYVNLNFFFFGWICTSEVWLEYVHVQYIFCSHQGFPYVAA
jgi:hypothetical protein